MYCPLRIDRFSILLTIFVCQVATSSEAALRVGDVIVAEGVDNNVFFEGRVESFRNGAQNAVIQDYFGDEPLGVAVDRHWGVYVTLSDKIQLFNPSGQFSGNFGPSLFQRFPDSISFDASENAFVGLTTGQDELIELNASGTLIRTFDTSSLNSQSPFFVDLDRDQCTLFFSNPPLGRAIGRFNVCTGQRLSDFATMPGNVGAVRVLADGGVLVADTSAIYRLNAAGQTTQTYTATGGIHFTAVALDSGGSTFWASSGASLYQFSLAGGPPILGPVATTYPVLSLAVVGEPRAALAPSNIPALTQVGLLALLFLLAGIALYRIN